MGMSRFNRPRKIWGRQVTEDAAPYPLLSAAVLHTTAIVVESVEALDHLPSAGEALHVILTGRRTDLMQLIVALCQRLGTVEVMRISTLSFHASNLQQMLGLLDRGSVTKLNLLACGFFRRTNKALFETAQREFRQRQQRVACARTHAKVVTIQTVSGDKLALETSANLRHNDCWEQMVVFRDPVVHDFHATWIDDTITKHEGDEVEPDDA